MNDLLEKIYENVIRQEDDTLDFEAAVSEFESKILAKYYAHYKSSY